MRSKMVETCMLRSTSWLEDSESLAPVVLLETSVRKGDFGTCWVLMSCCTFLMRPSDFAKRAFHP
eukprot:1918843-Amphidinium_carterae.2